MNLLFVADPLETFKTYKDTTFAMMREAAARGHALSPASRDLVWQRGGRVARGVRAIALTGAEQRRWFVETAAPAPMRARRRRRGGDAQGPAVRQRVLLRDAPARAGRARRRARLQPAGARCATTPRSSRSSSSRSSSRRPLVTRDEAAIKRFHARAPRHHPQAARRHGRHGHLPRRPRRPQPRQHHRDAEPQRHDDGDGAALPAPRSPHGDKRVLVIDGVPVPHSLARIPQGSEIRGNLAVGGKGVAQPLSARDREIAEAIGPVLAARGLLLVGLDVIGDSLTEINVTSPTGFQEITAADRLRRRRRCSSTRSSAPSPDRERRAGALDAACRSHGRPLPLQRPPRLRPRRPARRRRAVARGRRAGRPDRPQRHRQVVAAEGHRRAREARRRPAAADAGPAHPLRAAGAACSTRRHACSTRSARASPRRASSATPTRRMPSGDSTSTQLDACRRGSKRSTPGTGSSASRRRWRSSHLDGARTIAELSGGMKKRVALAQALVARARRAAARRADQPPRPRLDRLARGAAARLQGQRDGRDARPRLPRRASRRASSSSTAACCAATPATSPPTRRGRKSSSPPRRWPARAPTSCSRRRRSGSARASRRAARAASAASSGCRRCARSARRGANRSARSGSRSTAGVPSGKIVAELKHVSHALRAGREQR